MNVRSVWIVHRVCTNPVGFANIRGESKEFVDLAPLAFLSIVNMVQEMGGQLGDDFYPFAIFGVTEKETVGVLTAYDDKNILFMLVGSVKGKDLKGLPCYSNKDLRGALKQILRTLDYLIPESCKGLHFENQDFSYAIDYSVGAFTDLEKSGFNNVLPVRTVAIELKNGVPVSIREEHDKKLVDVSLLDPTTREAIQTSLGSKLARVNDTIPYFKGLSDQLAEYLGKSPDLLILNFGFCNVEDKSKKYSGEFTRFVTFASLKEEEEDVKMTFVVPTLKKVKGATPFNKILRSLLEKD